MMRTHGFASLNDQGNLDICKERGILDVTRDEVGPRTLRRICREEAAKRLWATTLGSRRMQITDRIKNPSTFFHYWDKISARVYLFLRIGSLRFRETWRGQYEARGEDALCPSRLCREELDTFNHMTKCKFYDNKWKDEYRLNLSSTNP